MKYPPSAVILKSLHIRARIQENTGLGLPECYQSQNTRLCHMRSLQGARPFICKLPYPQSQPEPPPLLVPNLQQPRTPPTDTTGPSLNVRQINCNGLKNKITDILRFISDHNVKIATLQETYEQN